MIPVTSALPNHVWVQWRTFEDANRCSSVAPKVNILLPLFVSLDTLIGRSSFFPLLLFLGWLCLGTTVRTGVGR